MTNHSIRHQCCVVGGGPAGMMLGLLMARSGIDVVVLEKHGDFNRDFRGDTIHPSTLELMHELGILNEFLQRRHQKLRQFKMEIAHTAVSIADFSTVAAHCQYIAFMPQWDFLNFIAEQAARYPTFHLLMDHKAVRLLEEDGNIKGVSVQSGNGRLDVYADLVIAADGRHSELRSQAGLEREILGAPIDALWMKVPKNPDASTEFLGHFGNGSFLVTIDRHSYWQCAYVIPKGRFDLVKDAGIEQLHQEMLLLKPSLGDSVKSVANWDDVSLLTVRVDRLKQWYRPGLLFIGDAAHAMSPVGGVGVNLAIQDAVAAANELVPVLQAAQDTEKSLRNLQRRREFPVKMTQRFQVFIQNRIIGGVLSGESRNRIPLPLRMIRTFPMLQRIPARIIGLGVRPEHIQTVEAAPVKN